MKMKKENNEHTSTMVEEGFCVKLRGYRVQQNMSQQELAYKASLDRTYVSQLENGKKIPTLTTICQLAVALQVEPWQLLYVCEVESEF